jgi:hypothetical protein
LAHGQDIWWLEAGIEEMYRHGHAACNGTSTRHALSPPSQMRGHVHDLATNQGNLLPFAESLPCEMLSLFLCKTRIHSLSEPQSIFLARKRQLMQMLFFRRRQPFSTTKDREPRRGECEPCFVSGRSTEGESCIHGESPKAPLLAPQSKPQHNTRRF